MHELGLRVHDPNHLFRRRGLNPSVHSRVGGAYPTRGCCCDKLGAQSLRQFRAELGVGCGGRSAHARVKRRARRGGTAQAVTQLGEVLAQGGPSSLEDFEGSFANVLADHV